jgi:hypothetical protein
MAQAVFEIADKLLTGGGHHRAVTVGAIALDTLIGLGNRHEKKKCQKQNS